MKRIGEWVPGSFSGGRALRLHQATHTLLFEITWMKYNISLCKSEKHYTIVQAFML